MQAAFVVVFGRPDPSPFFYTGTCGRVKAGDDEFAAAFGAVARQAGQRGLARRRRTSQPRSSVRCSAAYEIRKCVSRELKTLPGMMSRLLRIASATNSLPVPQGAFGNE